MGTAVLISVVAVLGLGALLALIGLALPERYVARWQLRLPCTVDQTWHLLTDHANEPQWRSHLERVIWYGESHGRPMWTEIHKRGERRTLLTEESLAPTKLIRSTAVEPRSYTGRWTFKLEAVAASEPSTQAGTNAADAEGATAETSATPSAKTPATQLVLEETVTISNPAYRLLARYIFGDGATGATYLEQLARRVGGDPAELQRLD